MKFIVSFIVVVFIAVQVAGEDFVCQQNVEYIENDCNGCFCTQTRVLGCTLKACPDVDNTKLFNCEVGTSWEKGCNQCWCVKNTGTVCTNKKC